MGSHAQKPYAQPLAPTPNDAHVDQQLLQKLEAESQSLLEQHTSKLQEIRYAIDLSTRNIYLGKQKPR